MSHTQRFSTLARCLLAACIMAACVPVWAATPQPLKQATAYFSQSGWPITNALNATSGSGWANGQSKDYMSATNQMGSNLNWLTDEASVNNIAVFNLTNAYTVTADDTLWFNLDFLASESHTISKFRLYVTDSTTVGDGDLNAWNSKTNQSAIQSKLGAPNIWTPIDAYLGATTLYGSALDTNGAYVTNMTGGNGGSEAYYLYAAMPDGISSIGAVKLEVLMEGPNQEPTRGPGGHANKNYILSEFQTGITTAKAADIAVKSTAVGYANWNVVSANFFPTIKAIGDGDPSTMTLMSPERDHAGFGYDFNGKRTVDEITFYQPLNVGGTDRQRIEKVLISTSQGTVEYDTNIDPADPTGKVTIKFDAPIDTSYLFVTPSQMSSGNVHIGISELEISAGELTPMTNFALGKTVTRNSGGSFHVNGNATNALTDGRLDIYGNSSGGAHADDWCWYFDNGKAPGTSWITIDLEQSELMNTIGIYQNPLEVRKMLEEVQLQFSDDPNFSDPGSITSFLLTLDEVMYQQLAFDDVESQYMRLTPMAYFDGQVGDWWGLAEVQLYYSPMADGGSGVPEPATWVMMLLAGVWLALCVRKRKS